MEKALSRLVSTERKKENKRIFCLGANLKELTNVIREKQGKTTVEQEEIRFILLTTDGEIRNVADLIFENARIECNLVTNLELIMRLTHRFREHFQKLSKRGAGIRIIVENLDNEDLVKRTLEKMKPNRGNFAAKLIYKSKSLPYQITDHKEVWISGKKETESGLPCVLWTNGRNMVQFFDESFKETWNNRHAISIYPERDIAGERIGKSCVSDMKRFYTTDSFFTE